jgi:hypothetical protein
MTPKIENGVFLNPEDHVPVGAYATFSVGPLLFGTLSESNMDKSRTGYDKNLYNAVMDQICFGFATDYVTHAYYATPAYGVQIYTSLQGANGKDYSGYGIGGGDTTIERSIVRLGVREETVDGVTQYYSTFKLHYQHAPFIRSQGVAADKTYELSTKNTKNNK